jgi:uncharacterized membrane protein YhaH (DUF805 family)
MNPNTATLAAYINSQRQSGLSDEVIAQSLISSGWPEEAVRQALQTAQTVGYASSPTFAQPQIVNPNEEIAGIFKGRIGRLGFLLAVIYGISIFIIPLVLVFAIRGSAIINVISIILIMIGVISVIPISISIHIRRWHDLSQSGWLALLGFVPLVSVFVFIYLIFAPGTKDTNAYGLPYSKSLSPKNVLFGFK